MLKFLTAPLLKYDVVTEPFPLLASAESGNPNKAKLTALATNGTGSDMVLQGIILQLPVGSGADALTNDSSQIGPVPPPNWVLASTKTPTGFVVYVFQPKPGFDKLPKGESLAFVLNNVEVNRKAGTFTIEITEGSHDCTEPDCPTFTTHLTKFPNGWGQVSFWANPTNLPYQGDTTLNWAGPQGAAYTIAYMAKGRVINIPQPSEPPLANQGKYPGALAPPLALDATTVFTLNVSQRIDNQEYHAQQQVTVSVAPPPPPQPQIKKFRGSVRYEGSQVELALTWEAELAERITITGVSGLQKDCDTLRIRPARGETLNAAYTLEARNGTASASSTVNVMWAAAKSATVGADGENCAILPDGSRLFSVNSESKTVSVLNPETLTAVEGSPFKVDYAPRIVVASPDSKRVYISQMDTFSGEAPVTQLSVFDSQTLRPVTSWPRVKDGTTIDGMAVSPDNKRIYVSWMINQWPLHYEIQVYDTSNMQRVGLTPVGVSPAGIAFVPNGQRAFVCVDQESKVAVIDAATMKVEKTLPVVGSDPKSVVVTRDGAHMYVSTYSKGSITDFDPQTLQELGKILTSGYTWQVAITPDGRFLFALGPSNLNVIDTATRTIVGSFRNICDPTSMAVSPDGFRVFILCRNYDEKKPSTMWMYLPAASGGVG